MLRPLGVQSMGRNGASSHSVAKLLMVLFSYAIHALIAGVRAVPTSQFAAGPLSSVSAPVDATKHASRHDPEQEAKTALAKTLDLLMIGLLVLLGGIFAGLTLGLMGLDMVNLQVLMTSGNEQERKNATKVMRLLERGRHWVLVVLLLGNVIVNETLPIFLSEFGSGLSAVIVSTVLIVIFGEIVPQSICARYGLSIGAMCAPLVHCAMILLAPVAWPTAKLLDYCLGEEHGTTYRKAELKTFVTLHQQIGTEHLNDDEVTIIRAVLDLNDKTLRDVMTPIEDVFTLSSDYVLDEPAVERLVESGYSRVPVHEPHKPDAIIGMLLVKRLIQYDPEDGWPVSRFQLTPLPEASPELNLLDAINYMQVGRSHMILVSLHPGEPTGALGVVTLEDIIEEMIGEEIVDETDVFVDVHNKIKVVRQKPAGIKQEQWQPLIRGIIERRRKYGGPNQTPLHNSFGTISRHGRAGSSGKYGLVPARSARDKVSMKHVGTPSYDSENSPNFSPRPTPTGPERMSSSMASEVFSDFSDIPEEDRPLPRRDVYYSETEPEYEAQGPYIVEMGGSQNQTPRVITVSDLNEQQNSKAMRTLAAAASVAHAMEQTKDQATEDEASEQPEPSKKPGQH
ncbi:cell agglutination protein Mam3 [Malassezia obtusa]|uniref:Cell agglutination protein Mam3 n=1 Tax=Malassezia obtusa TaxID=76774 RepID=A0AAF0E177_9BASI|nr:cell agglutination protein Mam3 [Malassezia obtusa]